MGDPLSGRIGTCHISNTNNIRRIRSRIINSSISKGLLKAETVQTGFQDLPGLLDRLPIFISINRRRWHLILPSQALEIVVAPRKRKFGVY
jgi:hypothetical protein